MIWSSYNGILGDFNHGILAVCFNLKVIQQKVTRHTVSSCSSLTWKHMTKIIGVGIWTSIANKNKWIVKSCNWDGLDNNGIR